MANAVNLRGSCFCMITGASQGIGQSFAVECAQYMGPDSVLLLIARNEEGLKITKSLCETPNVKVIIKVLDLSSATTAQMENMLIESLSGTDISKFDEIIVIHNAGSIGDLSVPTDKLKNSSDWEEYYKLNVFNIVALNCVFLNYFKNFEDRIIVVNVTSLCGIKPFAGLSMYCSGKAAREMYFKVLAEEHPKLKILNYSPGPVKTAMVQNIIDNACNASLKNSFITWKSEEKLLEPEQTARKFVDVLTGGNYKSGDHVDYFD